MFVPPSEIAFTLFPPPPKLLEAPTKRQERDRDRLDMCPGDLKSLVRGIINWSMKNKGLEMAIIMTPSLASDNKTRNSSSDLQRQQDSRLSEVTVLIVILLL